MSSRVKIIELLTSEYGVDPERISPEATLVDLGLNSLAMAELICDQVESFGIEIALAGPEIATSEDAIALTDRLVAEQEG